MSCLRNEKPENILLIPSGSVQVIKLFTFFLSVLVFVLAEKFFYLLGSLACFTQGLCSHVEVSVFPQRASGTRGGTLFTLYSYLTSFWQCVSGTFFVLPVDVLAF